MDLRTYVEDSKEAWMWLYSELETTAVNMNEVVYLQIKTHDEARVVSILAVTTNDETVVVRTFESGDDARDYLFGLINGLNAAEGLKVMANERS